MPPKKNTKKKAKSLKPLFDYPKYMEDNNVFTLNAKGRKIKPFRSHYVYNPKNQTEYTTYRVNPTYEKLISESPTVAIPLGFVFNKITNKLLKIYAGNGKRLNPKVGKVINENPSSLRPPNDFVINLIEGRLDPISKIMTPNGQFKKKYKKDYIFKDGLFYEKPSTQGDALFVENKYKNHRILVYNVFNYTDEETPATIEGFIENIKYKLETQFSYADKARQNQQVLLRFNYEGDKINAEYRYFPLQEIDNLESLIVNYGSKDAWGSDWGTQGYNFTPVSIENLDRSWFRINLTGVSGGAKGFVNVGSKWWVCDQIETTNNQCLEGAIKRHLGLKVRTNQMRKMICSINEDIGECCPIDIQYLPLYEELFKVRIDLYGDTTHTSDNCIHQSESTNENIIRILYKDEHYALIKKEKLQVASLTAKEKHNLGIYKYREKSSTDVVEDGDKLKELVVIFDNETVFDRYDSHFLKVYGVSWVVWDIDEPFNYDESKHLEEPICYYRNGYDCLREFILFLINPPQGVIYRPIGFNNSRFDNFSVAEVAKDMGVFDSLFLADGSILKLNIQGVLPFWDASRFLVGSLNSCCKNFNTNPKKAPDLINHYEIQCYFEKNGMDGLCELIRKTEGLAKYNKLDCLCLLSLTQKLYNSFEELFEVGLFKYLTISSMAYSLLDESWVGKEKFKKSIRFKTKDEKKELMKGFKPKLLIVKPKSFEDDLFFRKSLTAGRTQTFYGKLRYKHPVAMADYKSLYPFVMGNYIETIESLNANICRPNGEEMLYPYGDYKTTKHYVPNKLGIYRVDINHQRILWVNQDKVYKQMDYIKSITGHNFYKKYAPNVIAHRVKDKPLDWDYKGSIKNINLTSVDIEVIRKSTGDDSCITVYEGFYWEDSRSDLFTEFLEKPKNEKTRQDRLKLHRDPTYNDAIREVCKIIQNSVSGKLLEALHEDVSKPFTLKNWVNMSKDEKITKLELNDFGGGLSFITGKKDIKATFEDLKIRSVKPSYLGMFVYSYARRWIFEGVLRKYITLYMDTDSACMPYEEWLRCKDEYKGMKMINTGEYGCLEEEVCAKNEDGGEIPADMVITISPKNYLVENLTNDKLSKRKMKGVRKTDKWCPLEYFGKWDLVKDKTGRTIVNPKCEAKINIRKLRQDEIRRMRESDCCINCIDRVIIDRNDKCDICKEYGLKLKDCYTTDMFETMVKGDKIAVFCSMITRISYKTIENGDWEFSKEVKYSPSIEDIETIMKSNEVEKKGICITFGVSDIKEFLEKYEKFEKEEGHKYKTDKGKFSKSKCEGAYYKNNLKYDTIENQQTIDTLFKLKQVYMVKTL